jgi:hypothetical protein
MIVLLAAGVACFFFPSAHQPSNFPFGSPLSYDHNSTNGEDFNLLIG